MYSAPPDMWPLTHSFTSSDSLVCKHSDFLPTSPWHILCQLNFLKGECAPGWLSCGSGSNFTCVEDNGEHWKVIEPYRLQISPTDWILINLLNDKDLPTQCEVDAPCQPLSTPCHSSCPHGHLLVDDDHCVLQENLCPEAEQCVHDEDCQDNAGCLLSGTVRYIHFV